ncbi:NAD(P)-binding protein [Streptomyces sp. NPDC050704]|uniref:NAD(P)-binding protein n=1 Tax=Streptomyces sp. NPDC050704 TaxID=3157219 RepID=UPI0034235891
MSDHRTVDLLAVGAGMAGLTARERALRDGLSVVVVEIAGDVGPHESPRLASLRLSPPP